MMAASKEQTFTGFTAEQAAAYAKNRGLSYPRPLFDTILNYHIGARDVALDVGTGPGKVAIDLVEFFGKVLGCDTGAQMIEAAKIAAERAGASEKVHFAVAGGENCAEAFSGEQVDLITVAMAAHWFDMPKFYQSAAELLRPGGTLAMWTCTSTYIHPSTPNHEEIQKILSFLEDDTLAPYVAPGNRLTRSAYRDLVMPWTQPDTDALFNKASFKRHDWDLDGVPSAPPLADGTPGPFFVVTKPHSIQQFIDAVGSASMVVRWRAAHPDKANTEEDPVNITARKLREANGGKEEIWTSASLSLLLLRRA